jgi:hypothetical protein
MDLSQTITYLVQKDINLRITPKKGLNATSIELSYNTRHASKLIPKDKLTEQEIIATITELMKILFPKFRDYHQKLRMG